VRCRLGSSPLGHLGSLCLGLGLAHLDDFVFEGVAPSANLKKCQHREGGTRGEGMQACAARWKAMRVGNGKGESKK